MYFHNKLHDSVTKVFSSIKILKLGLNHDFLYIMISLSTKKIEQKVPKKLSIKGAFTQQEMG